jgi:hypothetical protein
MTDEQLEQLMKELQEKILGGNENETQTTKTQDATQGAQDTETYEETQQQEETTYDNVDEQQLQWWLNSGRMSFIAKYSSFPSLNINKYLPIIEQRALAKLQMDINNGRTKDTYNLYLEEALRDILKEFSAIGNDFVNVARAVKTFEATNKQPTKNYSMQDYKNDYKKMLEYITYKKIGDIYYKDSSEKGFYGEGKLRLGEDLEELNI